MLFTQEATFCVGSGHRFLLKPDRWHSIILLTMPTWIPTPGNIAAYIGRAGSSRRNMLIVAEAVGGRFVVEAIGRKGVVVRLTVKRDSLKEPQPDLFV
jgi:hypothetical protein